MSDPNIKQADVLAETTEQRKARELEQDEQKRWFPEFDKGLYTEESILAIPLWRYLPRFFFIAVCAIIFMGLVCLLIAILFLALWSLFQGKGIFDADESFRRSIGPVTVVGALCGMLIGLNLAVQFPKRTLLSSEHLPIQQERLGCLWLALVFSSPIGIFVGDSFLKDRLLSTNAVGIIIAALVMALAATLIMAAVDKLRKRHLIKVFKKWRDQRQSTPTESNGSQA